MGTTSKRTESRNKLVQFSKVAKELRDVEELNLTVNEMLLTMIYNTNDATEFNTFERWQEQGYIVVRGSKAFLIWGKPIRCGEKEGKTGYNYFPTRYLFSNKQVYKKRGVTPQA